jgi:molybdopterin molybdotransferase
VRVRAGDGALRARLAGPQGSGVVSSLAHANALALVPPEVAAVPAGGAVTVHLTEEPEDH